MKYNEENSFEEALHGNILAFKENPSELTYGNLLCRLFDGIEEDVFVPVPADMDWDMRKIQPRFHNGPEYGETLVVLTYPDGEKYPFFASVRLRAILNVMLSRDSCSGMLINPGESSQVFIKKELLIGAMDAMMALLEDAGKETD